MKESVQFAESILKLKDSGNKYVGYYFESALVNLISIIDSVEVVIENKDQSVYTYGEWAGIIEKEISNILSNDDNRVKIQSGNTYQLYNIAYSNYSMYCESGKLTCKSGSTTPKSRRFTFTSTGKENEYYISNNGKYINFIGKSQQVTATTAKKSEAVKFTVINDGIQHSIYKTGNTELGLHSSQQYVIVGWNHDENPSLWRLVATDIKKEKADEKELKALISKADSIYSLIVDTLNTETISFNKGIEVISETLADDVTTMMQLVAESENVISKKYYNECPALIEKLTAIIAVVKSGYTVSTGINGVVYDEENSVIYDVRGRRVNNITSSGIYIIDGKKVYIK